jgi:hypothetical protein
VERLGRERRCRRTRRRNIQQPRLPPRLHARRAARGAAGLATVLALMATASPPVREEIVERLRRPSPELIIRGFDRPNIGSGDRHYDEHQKRSALVERAKALGGLGIATSRRGRALRRRPPPGGGPARPGRTTLGCQSEREDAQGGLHGRRRDAIVPHWHGRRQAERAVQSSILGLSDRPTLLPGDRPRGRDGERRTRCLLPRRGPGDAPALRRRRRQRERERSAPASR